MFFPPSSLIIHFSFFLFPFFFFTYSFSFAGRYLFICFFCSFLPYRVIIAFRSNNINSIISSKPTTHEITLHLFSVLSSTAFTPSPLCAHLHTVITASTFAGRNGFWKVTMIITISRTEKPIANKTIGFFFFFFRCFYCLITHCRLNKYTYIVIVIIVIVQFVTSV